LRTITALLVLAAALAASGQATARDITLKKTSADELKAICTKVGGKFTQGPKRYGCGTDCKGGTGTDCIVSCAPDGKCVAQVVGGRRPRTIEEALTRPARH
jgi:hypothetical protein